MNIPIFLAFIMGLCAFFIHTFTGEKGLNLIKPNPDNDSNHLKQEKWTKVRCGWHWISFDLLMATIGLGIICFTNFFENEIFLLHILAIYFLGYAIIWLLIIFISKPFPMNYFRLSHWIFLLLGSGLIFLGTK